MGREPAPSGFVDELCLALAHRWEPERLFVIFTAYIDEAATHGSNPRMTLGAVLGNAYDWRKFERRLTALQTKYGFTVFHAKKFQHSKEEFKGWPRQKRNSLVSDLTNLIRTVMTEGITITLPRDEYLTIYRQRCPKGMHIDSQYGLAFRALLSHLIEIILDRGGKQHTLHIVLEVGHANVRDAVRIFEEAKKSAKRAGVDILGTITIAGKKDPNARPLMVADFLAHTHYLFDASSQAGLAPSYADMTEGIPNQRYDAGLTMMLLPPAWVDALFQHFLDEKQRRREWSDKAARKASVS